MADQPGFYTASTTSTISFNTIQVTGGPFTWSWNVGDEITISNPTVTINPTPNLMSAFEKARKLFLSCLTGRQLYDYNRCSRIWVNSSGGNRYIVRCVGINYNVVQLAPRRRPSGVRWEPVRTFCALPRHLYIPHDVWLAQKLALESDEDSFLEVAFEY